MRVWLFALLILAAIGSFSGVMLAETNRQTKTCLVALLLSVLALFVCITRLL